MTPTVMAAMNFDGLQNSVIENNLLFNNHTSGIVLFQEDGATASIGNPVVNNTVVMASDATAAIRVLDGSTKNVIFNNILLGGSQIDSQSESGMQMDFNIVSHLRWVMRMPIRSSPRRWLCFIRCD